MRVLSTQNLSHANDAPRKKKKRGREFLKEKKGKGGEIGLCCLFFLSSPEKKKEGNKS